MQQFLVSAPVFDGPLRQRRRLIEEAIGNAQQCALQSEDREAIAVASFLRTHTVTGMPLPRDRIAVLSAAQKRLPSPAVVLVPAIRTDTLVLAADDMGKNYADPLAQNPAFGSYYRSHQAIYWSRVWELSPLWEGLLLLHEGLHAYHHLIDPAEAPTRRDRERSAVYLEYRVLRGLAGLEFQELVVGLAHHSSTYNQRPERMEAMDAVLNGLLGTPVSPIDERARDNVIDRCVALERRARAVEQRGAA